MTASSIKDSRYSEFTLALLEGSGWYKVDYKYAEPMTYGKDAGCAFFDTKCMNTETFQPNFKEFCSPYTSQGISWTKRGFGVCGHAKVITDPNLPQAFDYFGNQTKVVDKFADNCPQIFITGNGDCEEYDPWKTMLVEYESYGVKSKAFMGTLFQDFLLSGETPPFGYCFKSEVIF